jgi:hypothetical protein
MVPRATEGYSASFCSEEGSGMSFQNCDEHSKHKNTVQVFTAMEACYGDSFSLFLICWMIFELDLWQGKKILFSTASILAEGPAQPPVQWLSGPGLKLTTHLLLLPKFWNMWNCTFTLSYILLA